MSSQSDQNERQHGETNDTEERYTDPRVALAIMVGVLVVGMVGIFFLLKIPAVSASIGVVVVLGVGWFLVESFFELKAEVRWWLLAACVAIGFFIWLFSARH